MTPVLCGSTARRPVEGWSAGAPIPSHIRAATRHRSAPASKVTDAEEQSDPAMLPVAPDNGPVPPAIPDDSEHDRETDPEA